MIKKNENIRYIRISLSVKDSEKQNL